MSIKGKRNSEHKSEQRYLTLQQFSDSKVGMDTLPKQLFALQAINIAVTSVTPSYIGKKLQHFDIVIPAHGANIGDVIWVRTGTSIGSEVYIDEVIDANTVRVLGKVPTGLIAAVDVLICRHMSMRIDVDGNLAIAQGALRFNKDAAIVEVTEDTVTPANNIPLPVKLTGVTGDINITANDLNVQLSHIGVNADSTRVGDGVEIWEIDADGSGTVRDADSIVQSTAINGKLPATIGQKANIASLAVALSTEQEAMLDGIFSDTTSLDGKDFSTQTTLAALLASFNAEDFATEATLAAILADTASLDGKDYSTEVTLAALSAKFNSLGQKANVNSAPVTLASEQEAKLDDIITNTGAINTSLSDVATETTLALLEAKDFSTETTLAALVAAFNAEDFASETTLAALAGTDFATASGQLDIVQAIDNIVLPLTVVDELDNGLYDPAVDGNFTTGAFTELVSSVQGPVKEIQVIEDIGEFMALYTGAVASEVFLCNLPLGGGNVNVSIASGLRITIKTLKTGVIVNSGNMAMNFLGV